MSSAVTLPPALAGLTVGGKKCEFWLLHGVGLAENVWAETHISSSRNLATQQVSSVHSSNTTKREFWVRLLNGKEKQISLPDNSSFGVREGHQLSLLCVRSNALSADSYYYVGVANHTTDRWTSLDNTWVLKKLAGTDNGVSQGLVNAFVLFTFGLGLIPLMLYNKSIDTRYVKPMERRIYDLAQYSFRVGFPASEG